MEPIQLKHLVASGISHSCFPNSGLNIKNEIIAIEPIADGQKITVDFSTLFEYGIDSKVCFCGCNGCRGSVNGFRQIPLIFQEKYIKAGIAPIANVLVIKN